MRNHNRKYQPFFDQRADYNTNAKSYYDYLAKMGYFFHAVEDTENRLLARDLQVETSSSILLTKTGDWQDDENGKFDDVITLSAESRISTTSDNILSVASDGLYVPPTDLGDINSKLDEIENDITNIEGDITNIQGDITDINNVIDGFKTTGNAIKQITGEYNTDIIGETPVDFDITDNATSVGIGYIRLSIYVGDDTTYGRGIFVPCSLGGSDEQTYRFTVMDQEEDILIKIAFDTNITTQGKFTITDCKAYVPDGAPTVNRVTFNKTFAVLPL